MLSIIQCVTEDITEVNVIKKVKKPQRILEVTKEVHKRYENIGLGLSRLFCIFTKFEIRQEYKQGIHKLKFWKLKILYRWKKPKKIEDTQRSPNSTLHCHQFPRVLLFLSDHKLANFAIIDSYIEILTNKN